MPNDIYQELVMRLKIVYHRKLLKTLLIGAAWILLGSACVLLAMSLTESLFQLSSEARLGMLILFVLGFLLLALYFIIYPALKNKFNPEVLAGEVGDAFPSLHDRLLNALQLYQGQKENPFAAAELELVGSVAKEIDFGEAIRFDEVKKNASVLLSLVALVSVLFFALPLDLGTALYRVWHYDQDFTPPAPFEINPVSGDVEVTKGDDAGLRFRLTFNQDINLLLGEKPEVRFLSLKLIDPQGFERQTVRIFPDSTGDFTHVIRNQKETVSYYAESPEIGGKTIKSAQHRVIVVDRPRVESFRVTITPPAYSRRPEEALEENFGDASALHGSQITIRAKATKPLKEAQLLIGDSLKIPMAINRNTATVKIQLRESISYGFVLTDTLGIRSEKSPAYQLLAIQDEPPTIEMIDPKDTEAEMPRSYLMPLSLRIRDDYGFKQLVLKYRLAKSELGQAEEKFSGIALPISSGQAETQGLDRMIRYAWDLNKQMVSAGDEIEFYAEVTDNDAVAGFKTARTGLYRLRLPTLDEIFALVNQKEKETVESIEKKVDESERVRKELEEIQNDLRQKRAADWTDRKQLEEAVKKQEALQKSAESLGESMQEMLDKMQSEQLISNETLEKYQQIQSLMSQIDSPELREALKNMEDALQKMDDRQIRQALKDLAFNEDEFKKKLERTLELLKQIQVERKFDELLERLSQMIDKEESLRASAEKEKPSNEQKLKEMEKEQQALMTEQKKFEDQLKDLGKKMSDFPQPEIMPLAEYDKLKEKQKSDQVTEDMKQASQKLGERKPGEAAEKQRQAVKKMQEARKQLSEMKESARRKNNKEILDALKNAARSAIELSMQQESLRGDFQTSGRPSRRTSLEPLQQSVAQDQQEILDGVKLLEEKIAGIGKKSARLQQHLSTDLRRAQQQMADAIMKFQNQQSDAAGEPMTSAMESLNRFADQIAELLSKAMQDQQGGGEGEGESMSEQMQKLSDQQGQLNSETEQMGSRMQADKGVRLAQIAAQQRLIAEQLRQLEKKNQQKGGKGELLGDLDKMVDEMNDVARKLQQQDLSRDVINRQQKILSRMLDATKSLRKEGLEEKREAIAGKNISKKSPQELQLDKEKSRLQDALNRLKEKGFSEDYEKLIRRYFESIESLGM